MPGQSAVAEPGAALLPVGPAVAALALVAERSGLTLNVFNS
ncbi:MULTISPECIES: hypothetical protein [unclassified Streptomyces]|nr:MULTISPECIES: hypothetical protein [unclassified Streptomyces]